MSSRFSNLRSESRKLKNLLADLNQACQEPPAWDAAVCCERTLGTGVPVELWYLAEHFLTAWQEWTSSLERHVRYFGTRAENVPTAWKALNASCTKWQERLWQQPELDQRIAASWRSFQNEATVSDQDAGSLFRQIVASHHRLMILPGASANAFAESRTIASQIDDQVRQAFDGSPPAVKREVIWHLRQYRCATLDFSWLDEERWGRGFSAFEHALGTPEPAPDWIAAVERDLSPDLAECDGIGAVATRIVQAIHEAGFDTFVADVTSSEMLGSPDSPLGSDRVAVVTGGVTMPLELSQPIVLALASTSRKRDRGTLSAVLCTVAQLLPTAASAFTIVIGDFWNASMFADEFLPQFRALYDRGHRFLFLVVGAPKTDLARIPVTLSGRQQLIVASSS